MLETFAREHKLQLDDQPDVYEFTWCSLGEDRYIRIDKRHTLVDAGTKRGESYEHATTLGFLNANGRPLANLAYYHDAANKATRR
jgi:hypothetical protein